MSSNPSDEPSPIELFAVASVHEAIGFGYEYYPKNKHHVFRCPDNYTVKFIVDAINSRLSIVAVLDEFDVSPIFYSQVVDKYVEMKEIHFSGLRENDSKFHSVSYHKPTPSQTFGHFKLRGGIVQLSAGQTHVSQLKKIHSLSFGNKTTMSQLDVSVESADISATSTTTGSLQTDTTNEDLENITILEPQETKDITRQHDLDHDQVSQEDDNTKDKASNKTELTSPQESPIKKDEDLVGAKSDSFQEVYNYMSEEELEDTKESEDFETKLQKSNSEGNIKPKKSSSKKASAAGKDSNKKPTPKTPVDKVKAKYEKLMASTKTDTLVRIEYFKATKVIDSSARKLNFKRNSSVAERLGSPYYLPGFPAGELHIRPEDEDDFQTAYDQEFGSYKMPMTLPPEVTYRLQSLANLCLLPDLTMAGLDGIIQYAQLLKDIIEVQDEASKVKYEFPLTPTVLTSMAEISAHGPTLKKKVPKFEKKIVKNGAPIVNNAIPHIVKAYTAKLDTVEEIYNLGKEIIQSNFPAYNIDTLRKLASSSQQRSPIVTVIDSLMCQLEEITEDPDKPILDVRADFAEWSMNNFKELAETARDNKDFMILNSLENARDIAMNQEQDLKRTLAGSTSSMDKMVEVVKELTDSVVSGGLSGLIVPEAKEECLRLQGKVGKIRQESLLVNLRPNNQLIDVTALSKIQPRLDPPGPPLKKPILFDEPSTKPKTTTDNAIPDKLLKKMLINFPNLDEDTINRLYGKVTQTYAPTNQTDTKQYLTMECMKLSSIN